MFWIFGSSPRRSIDELNALLSEATDGDILNLPLRSMDKEKLQSSPLLQYIVIRKQSVCMDAVQSFLIAYKF